MADTSATVTEAQILDRVVGDDRLVLTLRIPDTLLYLRGHFPDTPIVPGVALTTWAIDHARAQFGCGPQVAALSSVKFHQVLQG